VFLGCPKNQVDSEHVLGALTEAGYSLTTDPRSADLTVITTCAFLQSAVRESEAAIREALKLKQESPSNPETDIDATKARKKRNGLDEPPMNTDTRADVSEKTICVHPCPSVVSRSRRPASCFRGSLHQDSGSKKVVVAGCLVQRYGKSLKHKFPAVDLWVPLADMPRIPRLLASRFSPLASGNPRSAICNRPSRLSPLASRLAPRVLSTPAHFAYLKIADGCDNRCSYCMIPDIRGPFRSRPLRDIIAEARSLARAGVKELILVAQDTTLYGTDIYGKPSLARLLKQLGQIDDIRWLRLMYTHPAHLTEDVIDQFATNPKLCRYVDLPIQHVTDHLLRKMNRKYTRSDIELLLESLRAIPDMHVRTTIIVGLPGETAQDFAELLLFVRAARLDRLSCYAYSPEPGTKAARMSGQVSPAVKKDRVRRLMLAQAAISRANLKKLVGRKLTVLVDALTADTESHHKDTKTQRGHDKRTGSDAAIARTEWDAPEIDGVVKLSGRKVAPGRFVQALVTGSSTHDITAGPL